MNEYIMAGPQSDFHLNYLLFNCLKTTISFIAELFQLSALNALFI